MEEQRARQEQEARRGQATSGAEAATSRPETINESKKIDNNFIQIFYILIILNYFLNYNCISIISIYLF